MKCNLFEGRDSGKMTVIQKWVYKLPCSDVVTQMLLDQGVFIAQKNLSIILQIPGQITKFEACPAFLSNLCILLCIN